ncbi:S49 family peptidase [Thioclava litoralis]|uniref:S49 family peptidase n=1 Tax=Thioclava litoralis TaxID=3076557 RepID=A0ABZ1E2K1_9RHOB|nr:S49 family peptidase [Thioclava sp. FTW29]
MPDMDFKALLPLRRKEPRVALIRLQGAIGISRPGSAGLSDAALGPLIERAFRKAKPTAVALVINSPGGSPVQSALIAARIRRLADETGTPVHAFVEDVAASGGYWLACAADDIWTDPTSVVGSIGVISSGFGFDQFIHKHGVERRVHTAGGAKSFMDPFRAEKPEDIARLKRLLDDMHDSFKDYVRHRRGTRLTTTRDLFTGDIWTGRQALSEETGLIDGIAHVVPKLKELYGEKVRLMPFAQKKPLFRRFGAAFGGEIAQEAMQVALAEAEERSLRARYGL